ncbi:methylated-DNA--[protein]-cysteine S-methyltransferase [Marinobacter litoralis]|nr:methylated-DNA--[protein]-cysteine S-methyltransferase [Marinobacter litoralis]MBJ6138095.1 methylated-DNA--[protein]-cysteine S-methyltransferase [Marinobacter litoralis]
MYYGIAHSALGWALVVWSDRGLLSVDLSDQKEPLDSLIAERFPSQAISPADEQDTVLLTNIITVLEDPETPLDLPLALEGTAFQKKVWQALQGIPPGQTITYSELAIHLGKPKAVRAVANACGANQLAVIVPCHRVVRSDGGLGGYRWGIERKKALLNREAKLAAIVS